MADTLQKTIDAVTAKVGEWLTIPSRISELYARVSDPAVRDRIAAVDGNYQATKNLVQQGLDIAQRAKASGSLPALSQVPTLVSAASALLDATNSTKQLEASVGASGALTAPGGAGWGSLKLWGGLGVLAGLTTLFIRRRRRRRSRR